MRDKSIYFPNGKENQTRPLSLKSKIQRYIIYGLLFIGFIFFVNDYYELVVKDRHSQECLHKHLRELGIELPPETKISTLKKLVDKERGDGYSKACTGDVE